MGHVGGSVTIGNGGFLGSGNFIGTITVNGFNLQAGSTHVVEVSEAAADPVIVRPGRQRRDRPIGHFNDRKRDPRNHLEH